METEAERVRLTAGEGEVENLAISTPRAGPQSNAKKREIKNQTEKSKKSKPIRSIEGRRAVLFDFAGNQNNQTEIIIQKGGSMASGGARPGAGRPKKAVTQKILEGNPGKRPIEVVNFTTDNGLELPSDPPSYLSAKAKEIY